MKTASVIATKIGATWQIRGYTRPYVDILKANQCAWDGKRLVWTYSGAGLPDAIQQIVDGTYGLNENSPLPAPKTGNSENQVSQAKTPSSRFKRPYSRKTAGLFEKGAAVEWDSPSGIVCGEYLKPEDANCSRVLLGSAELVIHNDLLRKAVWRPTEPDGTCPYMIENQRDLKPGQFVEVTTNKVRGVVYNLSEQSDLVFIAVPDNSKKGGGYCGMGYSPSVLVHVDYKLPKRQVEFLQALAKGETVAKNGATRKALRNWGLISDDADWNQIILTRIGRAWLDLNGLMPEVDSGLVLGDGTSLSESTVEAMSYVATTLPSNPTCPRCNSKTHLNRVEDIWQSGLVVGTNREYICSSCKHTFERRQIFEKPKTNPKPAFAPKSRVTPLRQQYLDLKAQYPDHILFYRLGDFYETFDDDAETAARELDLVLTGRPVNRDERVPMAGVPHHAVDQYINRLVEKGYKVAVAEQMSEPNGRGIVERKVTRTLEPNLPEVIDRD